VKTGEETTSYVFLARDAKGQFFAENAFVFEHPGSYKDTKRTPAAEKADNTPGDQGTRLIVGTVAGSTTATFQGDSSTTSAIVPLLKDVIVDVPRGNAAAKRPDSVPRPSTEVKPHVPDHRPKDVDNQDVSITVVNDSNVKFSLTLTSEKTKAKVEEDLASRQKKTLRLRRGAYDAFIFYYPGPGSFAHTAQAVFVESSEKWFFTLGDLGWKRRVERLSEADQNDVPIPPTKKAPRATTEPSDSSTTPATPYYVVEQSAEGKVVVIHHVDGKSVRLKIKRSGSGGEVAFDENGKNRGFVVYENDEIRSVRYAGKELPRRDSGQQ
jgi:hypothetical protein